MAREWIASAVGVAGQIPRAVALSYRHVPKRTIAWLVTLQLLAFAPAAVLILGRGIIDAFGGLSGGEERSNLVRLLVLLVLVLVVSEALKSLGQWLNKSRRERLYDYFYLLIQRQSMRLDLAWFQQQDFYDRMARATVEAPNRLLNLVESLAALGQQLITLLVVAALLFTFGWWVPFVLILAATPAVLIVLRHGLRAQKWDRETTETKRQSEYYHILMVSDDTAAEFRLFSLGEAFRRRFAAKRTILREGLLDLEKRLVTGQLVAGFASLFLFGLTALWVLRGTLQGQYTIGQAVLFYGAFTQGTAAVRALFGHLVAVYRDAQFAHYFFEYLDLEPTLVQAARPVAIPGGLHPIVFEDVRFSYPGSGGREPVSVLRGCSARFEPGTLTAILGPNGAGKSTLLNLVCRFYDPDGGTVLLGDTDVREFDLEAWRQHLTVILQRPFQFHDTVAENLRLSRPDASEAELRTAVERAAAGGIVEELPGGLDCVIGLRFLEGRQLSQGQWQRIALARAYLREAPLLLLDEPTSAMDPWTEAEWSQQLLELRGQRTILLATHRLTTARFADRILVLRDGVVAESGSHAELLAQGGWYAAAWTQRQKPSS